ncbi:MAG: RluA family pseudouridine synthase [Treponema sp.]|jgi:23S rRNA pseudouridine955/2504/2580 synthase|nr:RluA family pseudouridine synthase [Treponema sp.]
MKRVALLFENHDCMVLHKPAGLAVQGGEGVGASLDRLLEAELSGRPPPENPVSPGPPKVYLVHRLDKDTSGLILVAKSRETAARFSALFAGPGRGIIKRYLALCAGSPHPPQGIIRLNLEIRGALKKSETSYRLLSRRELPVPSTAGGGKGEPGEAASGRIFSLLELELGTGRMHQIRRHLARIGCPVLGDDKYGDFSLNRELRKTTGLKRLLLHASRLVIPETLAGFPGGIDVSDPLPDYFRGFFPGEETAVQESPAGRGRIDGINRSGQEACRGRTH